MSDTDCKTPCIKIYFYILKKILLIDQTENYQNCKKKHSYKV